MGKSMENMHTDVRVSRVKGVMYENTSLSLDFSKLTISSSPPTNDRTISPAS